MNILDFPAELLEFILTLAADTFEAWSTMIQVCSGFVRALGRVDVERLKLGCVSTAFPDVAGSEIITVANKFPISTDFLLGGAVPLRQGAEFWSIDYETQESQGFPWKCVGDRPRGPNIYRIVRRFTDQKEMEGDWHELFFEKEFAIRCPNKRGITTYSFSINDCSFAPSCESDGGTGINFLPREIEKYATARQSEYLYQVNAEFEYVLARFGEFTRIAERLDSLWAPLADINLETAKKIRAGKARIGAVVSVITDMNVGKFIWGVHGKEVFLRLCKIALDSGVSAGQTKEEVKEFVRATCKLLDIEFIAADLREGA